MEQVYIDSARSPLQEYIIKLNQRCLVQIDDSKYKAGRHLWRRLYYYIIVYFNLYIDLRLTLDNDK